MYYQCQTFVKWWGAPWPVACLLVIGPPALAAQRTIQVPDEISCPTCRIVLDRRVTIQPPPAGLPGFPADVAVDRGGRIYLGFGRPPELMQFSSAGVFQRGWSRSGEGPGESRMIRYVQIIEGDSVVIYDPILQRASVHASAGNFVRAFGSPAGMSRPIQLGDGRFVLNELLDRPDRRGLPFHEVLRTGLLARSFGPRDASLRPTEAFRLRRIMAPATTYPADHFWAADPAGRYALELRSVGMEEPVLTIERRVAWFPEPTGSGVDLPALDRPPPARIWGAWQDAEGLLWVLLRVADPRWRSAVAPASGSTEPSARPGSSQGVRVTNPARYTDFRFEVMDPRLGRLVASIQVDEQLSIGSSPGVLIGYASGSDPDDPQWALIFPRITGIGDREQGVHGQAARP